MYIYRIEHAISLDGPYNNKSVNTDALRDALGYTQASNAHPGMYYDCSAIVGYKYDEHYCGFDTIEHLIEWFSLAFDDLHDHGFIVAIYQIDSSLVCSGRYQSIFVKHKAKRVEVMSITDIASLM